MRKTHLKIKIKSLSEESRIIKKEESKLNEKMKFVVTETTSKEKDIKNKYLWEINELRHHRKEVVGKETRLSLLAYGFLRATPYLKMENTTRLDNKPDFQRVRHIAWNFYSDNIFKPCFKNAKKHFLYEEFHHKFLKWMEEGFQDTKYLL